MAEKETGAGAGFAQGAAAGAAFGPWGALIGGVIGGAIGYISGGKKAEAKKFAAKAQEVRRRQQSLKLAIDRRDLIRSQRIARANAVAAGASEEGVQSSAVGGAVASIDAQGKSAASYFDAQVDLDAAFQMYAKKAGKKAGQAAEMDSLLGSLGSLATVGGDLYGLSKPSPQYTSTSSSSGYTSFNSSAAQTNMAGNSAFTSFGQGLDLK
jgi:hypothetical protein